MAKGLVVALLAVIAAVLMVQAARSVSEAQAQTLGSGGQAGKTFAIAGQITSDSYGLYLVDLEKQTIAMYQWLPAVRKLRFLAARNYAFDLQLEDYNTEQSPSEIRNLVLQQRRLRNAATQP